MQTDRSIIIVSLDELDLEEWPSLREFTFGMSNPKKNVFIGFRDFKVDGWFNDLSESSIWSIGISMAISKITRQDSECIFYTYILNDDDRSTALLIKLSYDIISCSLVDNSYIYNLQPALRAVIHGIVDKKFYSQSFDVNQFPAYNKLVIWSSGIHKSNFADRGQYRITCVIQMIFNLLKNSHPFD